MRENLYPTFHMNAHVVQLYNFVIRTRYDVLCRSRLLRFRIPNKQREIDSLRILKMMFSVKECLELSVQEVYKLKKKCIMSDIYLRDRETYTYIVCTGKEASE